MSLKSLLPVLLLAPVYLSACAQTISQKTVVPAPIVQVIVPSAKPQAAPVATADPLLDNRPAVSVNASTPPASAELPLLNLGQPIIGPSASPLLPAEINRFLDAIPEPELTKAYGLSLHEAILPLWQKRYQSVKEDPYEVLKMYLDAGMIAWYNDTLAGVLNAQVLTSKTPWLFPSYAQMDAQAVSRSKEYAIRSYYRSTSSLQHFALTDFDNRTVNLVSKNGRGEYTELSPQDARALAPTSPHNGSSFKFHLLSSASGADAELTMLYADGWKVDFWTPNILVAFMP